METTEIDLEGLKKRSVVGVVALTSRTFLLQLINFLAMFLLTVFLTPEVFGIFFVVTALVNFLNYFSDIGLAAALIQKKEALTEADLKTTFTIQQGLVLTLVVFAWFFSTFAARFYHLNSAGLWLLRALIFSFFLSSLKTIPSIILERKLHFKKLIIPQIGETLVFNLVAVFLAWKGYGVTSFTWGVVARGIVGLVLIYLISPWRPGLALERQTARRLLSFGIPFQLNSLLALVKDDLLTMFLGKVLPLVQVGYLGWAQKWANFPLRFVMDSVNKVSFPAYSRVQDNLKALRAGIEKALFSVSFLTFPVLIGMMVLARPLVHLLPRYLKWEPALIALYLFSTQAVFASVSTTLTNTLNATGRIKTTLRLMIGWTSLTWIFTPVFIRLWNFNGAALSALLVALTVGLPIILVKKIVSFNLGDNVIKPFLTALAMGIALLPTIHLINNLFTLFLVVLFGAIIYLSFSWLWFGEKLKEVTGLMIKVLKK
jgi:O-antigen/teichoic acid export membrane protein